MDLLKVFVCVALIFLVNAQDDQNAQGDQNAQDEDEKKLQQLLKDVEQSLKDMDIVNIVVSVFTSEKEKAVEAETILKEYLERAKTEANRKTICDLLEALACFIKELETLLGFMEASGQDIPKKTKVGFKSIKMEKKLIEHCKKKLYKVSGDPHFMVYIPGSKTPVCFDINGEEKDVMQLLHDESLGLTVNGELMELKNSRPGHLRSVFGAAAVILKGCSIYINLDYIQVGDMQFMWNDVYHQEGCGMRIENENRSKVLIKVTPSVHVEVRYSVSHRNLAVIFVEVSGLSDQAHGIFGQLERKVISVTGNVTAVDSSGTMTLLSDPSQPSFEVISKVRGGTNCWLIPDENIQLLDGPTEEYFIPGQELFYNQLAPGLRSFAFQDRFMSDEHFHTSY